MAGLNLASKYDIVFPQGMVQEITLGELFAQSERTLLFVYPKDNTPGCTLENKDFTCLKAKFEEKNIRLIGLSKDDVASHQTFIKEHDLEVPLISDAALVLHKELGAYGEKNNYGKLIMGVIRSTFLIDKNGELIKKWHNVKATGHVEKILKEIEKM